MSSYIKLVLINPNGSDKNVLRQAPFGVDLNACDKVRYECKGGNFAQGTVCKTLDICAKTWQNELDFVCSAANEPQPLLKVIGKDTFEKFKYEVEE